jgi:hypothetical protein
VRRVRVFWGEGFVVLFCRRDGEEMVRGVGRAGEDVDLGCGCGCGG